MGAVSGQTEKVFYICGRDVLTLYRMAMLIDCSLDAPLGLFL